MVEPGRVLGDVLRGRSHVIYISPITPKPRQFAKCSSREPGRDSISLHIQPGMTSGSLLIRDVEIQARGLRRRSRSGLQLPGGGALDHAAHQRCNAIQGVSQARTARNRPGPGWRWGRRGGRPPSLRRRAPAAVPCRAAARDQRTRCPSRS